MHEIWSVLVVRKIIKITATRCHNKANMHQIRFLVSVRLFVQMEFDSLSARSVTYKTPRSAEWQTTIIGVAGVKNRTQSWLEAVTACNRLHILCRPVDGWHWYVNLVSDVSVIFCRQTIVTTDRSGVRHKADSVNQSINCSSIDKVYTSQFYTIQLHVAPAPSSSHSVQ